MSDAENNPTRQCPKCGGELPAYMLMGMCPKCVGRVVFHVADEETGTEQEPSGYGTEDQAGSVGTRVRYIGDYELLEVIGRGGMGVVYRARQVSLNRPVAVKMILAGQLATQREIERFRQEAEAAAKLDHPNIVAIHEVGEHEGQQYFSMQLVEGQSLAVESDNTEAVRPLSEIRGEKSVAELMITVARAVDHAHRRGILHRDIKPGNILIDVQGEPHVTDFGLAKQVGSHAGLTLSEAVLGTPHYMSPEQAQGRKDLTTATDIYSLGAVLYFLLTGRPPFEADTPLGLLKKVTEEEPVPPNQARRACRQGEAFTKSDIRNPQPEIDQDLETICLKCLEKEPARRYLSAMALAEELERWLRQEPIFARPNTRWERIRKWVRRNPAVAALAGLSALLVLALATGVTAWGLLSREGALRARQQLARTYLRDGQRMCEAGDVSEGLLWLARALRECPVREKALGDIIRLNVLNWSGVSLGLERVLAHEVEEAKRVSLGEYPLGSAPIFDVHPDGKQLVVCGRLEHTARVWSLGSGAAVGRPMPHSVAVLELFYTARGERIVTLSQDGYIRLWSSNGEPAGEPLAVAFPEDMLKHERRPAPRTPHETFLHNLQGHPILAATALPAQGLIAAWPKMNVCRLVRVTDRVTVLPSWTNRVQAVRRVYEGDRFYVVAQFSPDGKRLGIAYPDGVGQVVLLGATPGTGTTVTHGTNITALSFSPDSHVLITAAGNSVRLWSAETGEPLGSPRIQAGGFRDVPWIGPHPLFAPDGDRFAVVSSGGVQLWSVTNDAPVTRPLPKSSAATCVSFSPDGKYLTTGGGDLNVWSAATGDLVVRAVPFSGASQLAFTPDGERLLASGDGAIDIRSFRASAWAKTEVPSKCNEVWGVDFHPDGTHFLIGGAPGPAGMWSTRSLKIEREFGELADIVWDMAYSQRGDRFVTAEEVLSGVKHGLEKASAVWSSNGELLWFLEPPSEGGINVCCAFHPGGNIVALGNWVNRAELRSLPGGARLAKLDHPGGVWDVDFHPNGKWLLTACGDGAARLWSVETTNLVYPPVKHGPSGVNCASFSPEGDRFATGSGDGTIRLWETSTGKPSGPTLLHKGGVNDLAFRPDGEWLITGGADGAVRLWSVAAAEQLSAGRMLPRDVMCVAIDPSGERILAGGNQPQFVLLSMPDLRVDPSRDLQAEVEILTGSRFTEHGTLVRLQYAEWEGLQKKQARR